MKRHDSHSDASSSHYVRLGLMAGLSFAAMYILMYSMVNSFSNVYNNLNQFYMAGLMAAPMVAIELIVMAGMYRNKRLNALLIGASAAAAFACFAAIRAQTGIADRQFLRSMIPHHAGAILMCEEAAIDDAAIRDLCRQIIASQQDEIHQMKTLLAQ